MTIQAQLKALLGTVDEKVYPNTAPDTPIAPYITYFRVSAVNHNAMNDNGGMGNLINTRFQIDVWSKTYAEAHGKVQAIKAALNGWRIQNVTNSEQDFYEPEAKLHRIMIDVSTWHN